MLMAMPQLGGRYIGDDGEDWIQLAAHKVVQGLIDRGANPCALDSLGRCPVTSAIAGIPALHHK